MEESQVSEFSIDRVRNACCEIVKSMSRQAVARGTSHRDPIVAGSKETRPVFLRHIHDEALMRMRSYLASSFGQSSSSLHSTSRYSKVLNNCLSVFFAGQEFYVLAELQPLAKLIFKSID